MYNPIYFDGIDLSKEKVLISLSGGINSAAVLAYIATEYPDEFKPKEVYLYYVHLKEHSPDTFQFVKDCIRYAYGKFDCVRWSIKWASVNKFFEDQHMIPHPIFSPCTDKLKIMAIDKYKKDNSIFYDLVGYIRTEKNRINRQNKKRKDKIHPISQFDEADCFEIVDREIGWHPEIYDIKDEFGNRVFKHNNCLPCKNFQGRLDNEKVSGDYLNVKIYYPEYFEKAKETSERMGQYWGRKEEEEFEGYCHFCEF